MARVYISIGSNVEREKYVQKGLDALAELLGELRVSSLYACEAVGFEGPEFYNLVVAADTGMSLLNLSSALRDIELANGRCPDAVKYSPRTLDLDLLLYDDVVCDDPVQLPRDEITKNAFVLWPLAEVAGSHKHPLNHKPYQQLWQDFDKSSQKIKQLPLTWTQK
ncbi:2-amino-4-hydroxy-6-hydroxymethyldihydropteridine diphosphokinase [Thalassotalea euphylliae]|uniref:2-amino-4-hydroxy-6- hydroxymethyldihydropteridine diphosphokinase n=1 Tax=Thalassotalea euphylliae TaxID=1655234 RepID=UPI003636F9BD